MHWLDRDAVLSPPCLHRFRHGANTWDDVSPEMRQEIRIRLEQLQGRLCAYCEGSLDQLGGHIEHFRCRAWHPQLTFDWNNLFWCCERTDSCGHYKDSNGAPYDVCLLIDPTLDDPDRFFRFNTSGTISIREGLTQTERRRAEETIRVFNLDALFGRLRRMREVAARIYLAQEPDIVEALASFSPDERREFILLELTRTATEPFCTVIRHLFEGLM